MDIAELIAYRNWANRIYFDYCGNLSTEKLHHEFDQFDKSIQDILRHLYNTTWYWFDNFIKGEDEKRPDIDNMSTEELISELVRSGKEILEFIDKDDINQQYSLQWYEDDNEVMMTAEQIIFNLVTHSAYHRGQLALMLRALGFEEITETDFNPYNYQKGQGLELFLNF